MPLKDIIDNKLKELEKLKEILPTRELLNRIDFLPTRFNFRSAINRPGQVSLIAEIKRMSPSAGVIMSDFDPILVAKEYITSGARALSVLTDEKFFGGKIDDIRLIKSLYKVPILRKDFIIDKYQVFETKYLGADALLLIVKILTQKELETFYYLTQEVGLEALVEVHTKEELERALLVGATTIGINNRDLETLQVDLKTTENLIKFIPRNKTIVSESGIKTRDDIKYLKNLGANAILIGEAFLKSSNVASKVKEIMEV